MSDRRLVVVLAAAFLLVLPAAAAASSSRSSRVVQLERLVAGDRHSVRWLASPLAPRTRERPRLLERRRVLEARHARALGRLELRLSWLEAVELVGRHFGAGDAGWLRSCSQPGSEGGWGRWVPNSRGSGAGGWLQFMSSTFYGVIDRAVVAASRRGMVVPAAARSWRSALGQAIAGVEMLAEGRRGEWTGWGC